MHMFLHLYGIIEFKFIKDLYFIDLKVSNYKRISFPGGSDGKTSASMWETGVHFLGWEDPLEKEMAIHSNTLAWKIPWMEEPDRLQSMGLQRVGHD